jgi:hypothetical protein
VENSDPSTAVSAAMDYASARLALANLYTGKKIGDTAAEILIEVNHAHRAFRRRTKTMLETCVILLSQVDGFNTLATDDEEASINIEQIQDKNERGRAKNAHLASLAHNAIQRYAGQEGL